MDLRKKKHGYKFIQAYDDSEREPEKKKLNTNSCRGDPCGKRRARSSLKNQHTGFHKKQKYIFNDMPSNDSPNHSMTQANF